MLVSQSAGADGSSGNSNALRLLVPPLPRSPERASPLPTPPQAHSSLPPFGEDSECRDSSSSTTDPSVAAAALADSGPTCSVQQHHYRGAPNPPSFTVDRLISPPPSSPSVNSAHAGHAAASARTSAQPRSSPPPPPAPAAAAAVAASAARRSPRFHPYQPPQTVALRQQNLSSVANHQTRSPQLSFQQQQQQHHHNRDSDHHQQPLQTLFYQNYPRTIPPPSLPPSYNHHHHHYYHQQHPTPPPQAVAPPPLSAPPTRYAPPPQPHNQPVYYTPATVAPSVPPPHQYPQPYLGTAQYPPVHSHQPTAAAYPHQLPPSSHPSSHSVYVPVQGTRGAPSQHLYSTLPPSQPPPPQSPAVQPHPHQQRYPQYGYAVSAPPAPTQQPAHAFGRIPHATAGHERSVVTAQPVPAGYGGASRKPMVQATGKAAISMPMPLPSPSLFGGPRPIPDNLLDVNAEEAEKRRTLEAGFVELSRKAKEALALIKECEESNKKAAAEGAQKEDGGDQADAEGSKKNEPAVATTSNAKQDDDPDTAILAIVKNLEGRAAMVAKELDGLQRYWTLWMESDNRERRRRHILAGRGARLLMTATKF